LPQEIAIFPLPFGPARTRVVLAHGVAVMENGHAMAYVPQAGRHMAIEPCAGLANNENVQDFLNSRTE
jgi:hypothetical protein